MRTVDMVLSDVQKAAVLDTSERVLVAAGAGSGKTRLLVAYFVRALVDEGLPPERLVAVTFTRKAAAELGARIRRRLQDLGRPDLALALDAATVGTIHSLCAGLLRESPLEAGIDPAFSVLEAEAAALVKQEVWDKVWDRAIEEAKEADLDVLGSHSGLLRGEVVSLYERLRGSGKELPRVLIPPGKPAEQVRATLAEAVREALGAGLAVSPRSRSLESDLAALEKCLSWIESSDTSFDPGDRLRLSESFFPSRLTPSMQPYFEPVRVALTLYRLSLAEQLLRPVVAAMNDLLERFHLAYDKYKRERSLLDFIDLELRARALLRERGRVAKETGGQGLRVMIDEFQDTNELQCSILEGLGASRLLMVGDERQSIYRFRGADVDVFRRREAAFEPHYGEGEGQTGKQERDEGQGHGEAGRQREASQGLEASRGLETGRGGYESPRGSIHRLDVNYRSRAEILSFINRVFADECFFGSRFVALQHGRDEDGRDEHGREQHGWDEDGREEHGRDKGSASLTRSAESGPSQAAVEVVAVDRLERRGPDERAPLMQEAEAQAVASCVRRLLDEERWEPREIVVLTPAQTHVDLYQQALVDRGADVYVVGGKGYYSKDEIADLSALLRLLVNPHDDLGLVTVLRSPIVGLSDDGLYLLGREARARKAQSLWEVVREGTVCGISEADRELLLDFVERLVELRRRVGRPGLARLIDDAVSDCGYDVCLLASAEGKRRFANVRKLMRIADDYEALQGPDLAGFVDAIDSMGDLSDREGSAPTLAEGENVVRVMTVHQAKGLEFPVVVLAGLGSDVPQGNRPRFVFSADGRMGVFLRGSGRKTYESGDLSWGPAAEIAAEERTKEREEDVRLLYVAMTRAKERLVLVGAKPLGEGLDGCRIGRIALALGFDRLPSAGTTVPIEGLDAVVVGVTSSVAEAEREYAAEPEWEGAPAAGSGPEELQELPDAIPRFMECTPRGATPRHMSFSALATYERCPMQFYMERVLGLRLDPAAHLSFGASSRPSAEDPDVDSETARAEEALDDEGETLSGRAVGLIVHALLERHALDEDRPALDLLREEAADLAREVAAEIGLSETDQERVLSLTQAFWRSSVAKDEALAQASRETPFVFTVGDTVVSGVMDLVWQAEGVWHIVDYKTNALGGRAVTDVAAGYEMQGAIYALAALRAGAQAVLMDFLFLERPEAPVRLEFCLSDGPRLESLLDLELDRMKQGHFPAQPGEECARCAVAGLCDRMAGSIGRGIE